MTTEFRWLHLSDFHFASGGSYDADVILRGLISSLPCLLERYGAPHLVFATGDIAFSGKKEQYQEATKFFDRLLHEIKLTRKELLVIP